MVVTDINGCKDSISRPIAINYFINAGPDTAYCSNTPVTHVLQGGPVTPGTPYTWQPAAYLDNNTLQNPTATITTTTTFYLTAPSPFGCLRADSVVITVNPLPAINTINDISIL